MFLPIQEKSVDWFETISKKLLCLSKEELHINGAFDSDSARQINIQLKKCHDRPDCKSDSQIKEYFAGKFLALLYNQIRFDSRQYG